MLSRINWNDPRNDPILRQFVPLKSVMLPDHPKLSIDSLHEDEDSPVKGLVHRYPDKALFLPVSVCPTYCSYCTRCRAVGGDTDTVRKDNLRPSRRRWDACFEYIRRTPQLRDVVVSGGDAYYLQPDQLAAIGERLIDIPHVRRFRFASKGLAVAPARILDDGDDAWLRALTHVVEWITERATQKLFELGITVRNQSVLLRGINDDVETMTTLIHKLADNNINPYYVYQCDPIPKAEHFRTPLSTLLHLESQVRGSLAGFLTPNFVVDLPGGGGKQLAANVLPGYYRYHSGDEKTKNSRGVARFVAPAVMRRKGRRCDGDGDGGAYVHYDPLHSLNEEGRRYWAEQAAEQAAEAAEREREAKGAGISGGEKVPADG
ncbi:hypothetical protein GGR56DRAFT_694681 [Xylariaceae sp. FL0804]|nr:hypothetical protein GGR56DRAFT_694681 [Xylariaceae sp. FL0804]